jgi:hypothetical protein
MRIRETIKRVLNEGIKDKMIKLIDETGVVTGARYVGGYDELKRLLGDYEIPKKLKIDAIKEVIDTKTDGGIHLGELDRAPIFYHIDYEDNIHQIEYLGSSVVVIMAWGGYKYQTEIADYDLPYEELTHKILDDIIEIIMEEIV